VVLCVLLVLAAIANVRAQTTICASLDSSGNTGNWSSGAPSISADGNLVAFVSGASNLVSNDTNGTFDVFVYDRISGSTTRVSVDSHGDQADGSSMNPTITPDGRFVAFESDAPNLASQAAVGPLERYLQVYLHDRQTGETSLVSSWAEGWRYGGGYALSLSDDGRFVAYYARRSQSIGTHCCSIEDVLVHDRQTGMTETVSVDSHGNLGDGDSWNPSLSADGRLVAFMSEATNLVPDDTNGWGDIFVHDRQTGETTRVSVDSQGTQANFVSSLPRISADGRYVVFQSQARNLVLPHDDNGYDSDVFVHDRQTGLTTLVSVSSSGEQGNASSTFPAISADGRYIAFASDASNLVPGDHNYATDVFLHDMQTGATSRVSINSNGVEADLMSGDAAIAGDGRAVAFDSLATNLIHVDDNYYADVFVHEPLEIALNGIPHSPNPIDFVVSHANPRKTGNLVLVMLSCSGTAGFDLPNNQFIYLTFDACTSAAFSMGNLLSAIVDTTGTATTPALTFPPLPPGLPFYAAAVVVDPSIGQPVAVTDPILFVSE
jgi:Tol biopolymer transport system component